MSLTPGGLQLLKTLEGCSLLTYLDPSGSGSWSIGYGHNCPEGAQGQQSSQQQADAGLPQDVALSPQQRDALISFCFNVGAGPLKKHELGDQIFETVKPVYSRSEGWLFTEPPKASPARILSLCFIASSMRPCGREQNS